jgi:outer membrane receptor protein involved in Fe transport
LKFFAFAPLACCAVTALAQEVPVEKIEVTGHYDNRLGTFDAASQGTTSGRVRSSKTTACESKATTLAYGRVAYRISPAWKVSLDGFNLFDRKASDIEYFYRSRLPGEPAGGVEDVHFHPVEPRTFRVTLSARF